MARRSEQSDINVVLLGQTGVGKSTIINAFANYLTYPTLDAADQQDMIILISASFPIMDPQKHAMKNVTVGIPTDREWNNNRGESNTQGCQSYKFVIGNRTVRLIDTPGIGDTRGLQQDNVNVEHILAYINQYKYLHGICILMNSSEQRLTPAIRYCITELLAHLHESARHNILFLFTFSRTSFFEPGPTVLPLRAIIDDLEAATGVEIPFSDKNTFCIDNEAFRFLAATKQGIKFPQAQKEVHIISWEKSADEFKRLFAFINQCPPHDVQDTISINTAQQLIRKLNRPISEVLRLITENIDLVEQYKKQIQNRRSSSYGPPKPLLLKDARIVQLDKPRTVCTSEKCTRVEVFGDEVKVVYEKVCHQNCRLHGVDQEVINHPTLLFCKTMNKDRGACKECGCHYSVHMHMTYELEEFTTEIDLNTRQGRGTSTDGLSALQQRIEDMTREQKQIVETASKLSVYLHENSITTYNDGVLEYMKMLIQIAQQKQDAGDLDSKVAESLEHLAREYKREVEFLKKSRPKLRANERVRKATSQVGRRDARNVFKLIDELFDLSICGPLIREQVKGLKRSERNSIFEGDILVEIAPYGPSSELAKELIQTSPAAATPVYSSPHSRDSVRSSPAYSASRGRDSERLSHGNVVTSI